MFNDLLEFTYYTFTTLINWRPFIWFTTLYLIAFGIWVVRQFF